MIDVSRSTTRWTRLALLLATISVIWATPPPLRLSPLGAQTPVDEPPTPPAFPLPKIEVPRLEFEWGEVIQGAVITTIFPIHNRGTAPLKILKVTSNCGCTSTFYSEEIAPGEEGRIELKIDTAKLFGRALRKNATVFCNDPTQGQVTLWLRGDVIPLLKSTAAILKVSGICEEMKEARFRFTPGTDQPTTVVGASLKGKLLEVVKLTPLDGGGAEVHLRAGPGETPAFLRDELLLQVKVGENDPVEVQYPVVIEHLDRVRFSPSGNIVFYRRQTAHLESTPPREVAKEIHLRATRKDLPIQVTGVRVEDAPEGLFRAEVRAVVPGEHYVIKIHVLKTMTQQQVQGRVVIEIDDPIRPTREREVFAQFRLRNPAG
jgi:hypothetical protein